MDFGLIMVATDGDEHNPLQIAWTLRVQEDCDGDRLHWDCAGRVKLQDEPVVTALAILQDAADTLNEVLAADRTLPLF